MNERIKFHLDEHIPNAVANGLREYGIDVTTPSDADLLTAEDRSHLEYARITGRMMVTYDSDYIRLHRLKWEHAGIAYVVPRSRSIGRLIESLCLYYEVFLADEMKNRLEYI